MPRTNDPWVLCDIDGTISDDSSRLHIIKPITDKSDPKWKPLWDKYHMASEYDPTIIEIMKLINYVSRVANIAFLTARPSEWEGVTRNWLFKHATFPYSLHMRPAGNFQHSAELKQDIVGRSYMNEAIWFAIDDNTPVVEMYRSLGIICLQPKDRNYE